VKRYLKSRRIRVIVVVVGVSAVAWAADAAWDIYKVSQMTEKMKTVCVGRMLIDLPAEAEVELYGAWISGFDIDAFAETPEAFKERVAVREAEIRATPDRLGGNRNMESTTELRTADGLKGKLFVHGRYVTEGQESDGLTVSQFRYEGLALEAHVHAEGISIDLTAKKYDPDRAENLSRLVAQLVPNPANRMPAEPGFCLDRAYIRDPLKAEQGERITMAVKLPSRPDIGINFDTIAGTKPDPHGLLERNRASRERLAPLLSARVTDLRAARRTISGLSGDELVQRVIENNLAIVYGFHWEVIGTEDNVFVPDISLMMVTGRSDEEPVRSSLSEPAALALWDRIVSTVRVRSAAPAKAAMAVPPVTPLGMRALAGELCAQSGWWECAAGTRQYIRQGAQMPQARPAPQTLWEKLRGIQPSHEAGRPTEWTLVSKRVRQRLAHGAALAEATPAGSGARAGENGAVPVSLGSQAMTADPCPASGWWRCADAEALDGTRWFAQGSLLPPATFTVPGRGGATVAHAPRAIRRRASWQLMRLAETPAG
jgi:hypothetical protein